MPGHTDSEWSAALVAGVGPYEPTNCGERRRKWDLSGAPDTQDVKGEEMDLILRFRCDSCHKEFMVADEQVDAEYLNCPHCPGEVEVPEDEEGDVELGVRRSPVSTKKTSI